MNPRGDGARRWRSRLTTTALAGMVLAVVQFLRNLRRPPRSVRRRPRASSRGVAQRLSDLADFYRRTR